MWWIYGTLVIYSMFCAPNVFFKYMENKNLYGTLEYEFFYRISCIFLGFSLIAIADRLIELWKSK